VDKCGTLHGLVVQVVVYYQDGPFVRPLVRAVRLSSFPHPPKQQPALATQPDAGNLKAG